MRPGGCLWTLIVSARVWGLPQLAWRAVGVCLAAAVGTAAVLAGAWPLVLLCAAWLVAVLAVAWPE